MYQRKAFMYWCISQIIKKSKRYKHIFLNVQRVKCNTTNSTVQKALSQHGLFTVLNCCQSQHPVPTQNTQLSCTFQMGPAHCSASSGFSVLNLPEWTDDDLCASALRVIQFTFFSMIPFKISVLMLFQLSSLSCYLPPSTFIV